MCSSNQQIRLTPHELPPMHAVLYMRYTIKVTTQSESAKPDKLAVWFSSKTTTSISGVSSDNMQRAGDGHLLLLQHLQRLIS